MITALGIDILPDLVEKTMEVQPSFKNSVGGLARRSLVKSITLVGVASIWTALAMITGCTALKDQMVAPRDNERLGQQVAQRLYVEGLSDHADIALHAYNGLITLNGHVPSEHQAMEVITAAAAVPGVSFVENRLRVDEKNADGSKPRLNLIEDVREALESTIPHRGSMLLVEAEDGVVYLSGIVPDSGLRSRAMVAALSVVGVQQVEDNLVLER